MCRDERPVDPQGIYVIGLPSQPGGLPKTGHRFATYCEACVSCYTQTHAPTPFFVLVCEYEDLKDELDSLGPSQSQRAIKRRMAAVRERYHKKLLKFFATD